MDQISEPHGPHPDHQKRHTVKKSAIHQRADDLGAIPSESARHARRTARNPLRDGGYEHTADRRKRVQFIRQHRDHASPEPHVQFDHEVARRRLPEPYPATACVLQE